MQRARENCAGSENGSPHDPILTMANGKGKQPMKRPDVINHPPHYKAANGIETIDVIEGFGLDFRLGNAVKYLLRCGKKCDLPDVKARHAATIEDLQKARWYIDRSIKDYERRIEFWRKMDATIARNNRKYSKRRPKR